MIDSEKVQEAWVHPEIYELEGLGIVYRTILAGDGR
jgi:hypothetical protein